MADALVITGATATGKTALAIDVACALGGEIISFDSRQVYQSMDIGTAKATPEQRAAVRHYGLDLVTPAERYSAGRFAADCSRWLAAIRGRGAVPVMVGGTGFFLKALTHPLFQEPRLPADRREALKSFLAEKPIEDLLEWVRALDPGAADQFAQQGGRQRLARALEIALLTGQPLAWWHAHAPAAEPIIDPLVFVLELPRAQLYHRINQRVHDLIGAGLVDEVRALVLAGYDERAPGMNATGYIELIPYIRGQVDLATAIDAIQRATRRYARRQLTWLRHQLPPRTLRLDAARPASELVATIVERWEMEVNPAYRN
jgi:tRNA dimethylallyltransferase